MVLVPVIVPTLRAALLIALAAPVALVVAAMHPAAWIAAPALGGAVLLLVLADGLLAGRLVDLRLLVPRDAEVGAEARIVVLADLARPAGGSVEAALEVDSRLADGGRLTCRLRTEAAGTYAGEAGVVPGRRGTGAVRRVWLRWTGPLGLGARHHTQALEDEVRIRPNLSAVRSPALQLFLRNAKFGTVARRIRGEGSEFEAMSEYAPGMDRRRIDWKTSARHTHLFAREYEVERNNQIVFAFDCGQAMCEPVEGQPRIDRAVSAALTTAYVALKGGDKVALFGFAARPEVSTPFVSGSREFHRLQEAAAGLDYHAQEPNFTLALATLTGRLQRRSLVVVFSDFTDPTSAELMIESVGRLVARHRVIFVTMTDVELDDLAHAEPADLQTLTMAVAADSLLRQRALVLSRLRQLGVEVIEAPYQAIGTRLIDAYLAIKRAGTIG
jgi:uncharacterized protein (DUF58 family)